jgi:hypothetical protein
MTPACRIGSSRFDLIQANKDTKPWLDFQAIPYCKILKLIMELKMFSKSLILGIIISVVGSLNLFSQCQTPWVYGGTVTVDYGFDCTITASYCKLYWGGSDVCEIMFYNVTIGGGCQFAQDANGYDLFDWTLLVDAVLNSHDFQNCLGVGEVPLCGTGAPKKQVRVSTGGCFTKTVITIPPQTIYERCASPDPNDCRSTYEFCKVWDANLGKFIIQSELISTDSNFDCEDPSGVCKPWCANNPK